MTTDNTLHDLADRLGSIIHPYSSRLEYGRPRNVTEINWRLPGLTFVFDDMWGSSESMRIFYDSLSGNFDWSYGTFVGDEEGMSESVDQLADVVRKMLERLPQMRKEAFEQYLKDSNLKEECDSASRALNTLKERLKDNISDSEWTYIKKIVTNYIS